MSVEKPSAGLDARGEHLAWIFGSSRSGSTWLLRMIAEAAGVVPIDDPHIGHHLGVWRPIPLAWAASDDVPELSTLLEVKADEPGYFFADRYRDAWWEPLRELIRARFAAQRQDVPSAGTAPTYVVKEPGSHTAALLADLFPDSRVIFLLRDGRDVVDSWLDAYQANAWAIRGGAFPVAPWGRLPLIRWLSAVWVYRCREVRRTLESRPADRRLLIRYEKLREDAATALAEVFQLLGLDGERVEEIADRHRFERVPAAERGSGREIRRASPGSWREHMSPAEQLAMHEVMGETLEEFGYRPLERAVSAVS